MFTVTLSIKYIQALFYLLGQNHFTNQLVMLISYMESKFELVKAQILKMMSKHLNQTPKLIISSKNTAFGTVAPSSFISLFLSLPYSLMAHHNTYLHLS